jgi:hypothetical protein
MKSHDIRPFLLLFFLFERSMADFLNWVVKSQAQFDEKLKLHLGNLIEKKQVSDLNRAEVPFYGFFPSHFERFLSNADEQQSGSGWRKNSYHIRRVCQLLGDLVRMRNSVMHGRLINESINSVLSKLAEFFADMRIYLGPNLQHLEDGRIFLLSKDDLDVVCRRGSLTDQLVDLSVGGHTIQFLPTGFRGFPPAKISPRFQAASQVWVSLGPVPQLPAGDVALLESLRAGILREGWAGKDGVIETDWSSYRTGEDMFEYPLGIPRWLQTKGMKGRYVCIWVNEKMIFA